MPKATSTQSESAFDAVHRTDCLAACLPKVSDSVFVGWLDRVGWLVNLGLQFREAVDEREEVLRTASPVSCSAKEPKGKIRNNFRV